MINFAPFLFCCQLNATLFIIELHFVPPAFLHRLLTGLFFFMIVLLVTKGGLLLPLLAERLAVGVATSGCAVCHVISRLIPFQSASKLYHITHKPSKIGMTQSQANRGLGNVTGGKRQHSFFLPACSLRSSS